MSKSPLRSGFAQYASMACTELVSSADASRSPWSASVAARSQSEVMLPQFFAHFKLWDMTLRHLRRFGRQAPWGSDNQRSHARGLRCLHYLNTSSVG